MLSMNYIKEEENYYKEKIKELTEKDEYNIRRNQRQQKEIEKLKNDLINLLRIIDKNCNDLEGTEEEFNSLDRAEDLLQALEEGKENEKNI